MTTAYYEDLAVGDALTAGEYHVTREAMIRFAEQWDPWPMHVDEAAAAATPYGGLIASGCMTISIKQWLVHRLTDRIAVIGSMGFEHLRFAAPVRAGDRLSLALTVAEKRVSRSRPDAGIVQFDVAVLNQQDAPVLTYRDIILVERRENGADA